MKLLLNILSQLSKGLISHDKIQSKDMEQNETSICEPSCVIVEHAFIVHCISHSCRVIMAAEVRAWELCSEHIFFSSGRKLHQIMIIVLICTFQMTSTQTERLIDKDKKYEGLFVTLCWNRQVAHLYFIQQHFSRKCPRLWACVKEVCELSFSYSKCRTLQKQQQNMNTSGCSVSCTGILAR